jgi:hypothetical protein
LWQTTIHHQIEQHKQLNLLYRGQQCCFQLTKEMRELIKKMAAGEWTENEVAGIVSYAAKAALSSFYQVNQYFQFDAHAEKRLEEIYLQLWREARENKEIDFGLLAETHFLRLQQWLIANQPDALLLFPADHPTVENKVVCAEYSPALQLTTMHIDLNSAKQPILDIGCGKEHRLVNFLLKKNVAVFGIDRDTEPAKHIQRISWLDFAYTQNKWGTIISHLGFSNHFRYQHLKQNSVYTTYAMKYVEILQSLKIGGVFYYAPDLFFIEMFLNPQQYRITKHAIANTSFSAVAVQRLK